MEVSSSSKYTSMEAQQFDVDQKGLESLLEAFGSEFTLEDIAMAYCEANRNADTAADILCALNGNTSSTDACSSRDKLECTIGMPSDVSSVTALQKSFHVEKNNKGSNSRRISASTGTVSGVIGKEYIKPRRLTNGSREPTKPVKIDSKEFPISEIWKEDDLMSTPERNGAMCNDLAEFLYSMLGDGFRLEMSLIEEVLGHCGYDMQKSMEKLLYLSARTLEKSDDIVGMASEKSDSSSQGECQTLVPIENYSAAKLKETQKRENIRLELQKEVLSLFQAPGRAEEPPRKLRPRKERENHYGKVVSEPFRDTTTDYMIPISEPRDTLKVDDDDDENGYDVLRKAVKEYWIVMKEYYKASVDAFSKGDIVRAKKLLEEGHFFKEKAQEADEKSAQKLLETRENNDVVPLDLRGLGKREALDLLKTHLTLLSGIPSIQHIRVLLGTSDDDTTKGAKKRLIVKLLERESITFKEEADGQMMLIRVDTINPKNLSFEKNKNQF